MKKITFILFLMLAAAYAKGQEQIQLDDLVGKWRLAKIEEVQMQGDAELSRQEYTPSGYLGEIPFEGFVCTADSKLSYTGNMHEKLKDGGNIQINSDSNEVFFHGKQFSLLFIFSWQNKPTTFFLERMIEGNQQTIEKKIVRFFYEKE